MSQSDAESAGRLRVQDPVSKAHEQVIKCAACNFATRVRVEYGTRSSEPLTLSIKTVESAVCRPGEALKNGGDRLFRRKMKIREAFTSDFREASDTMELTGRDVPPGAELKTVQLTAEEWNFLQEGFQYQQDLCDILKQRNELQDRI